MADVHENPEPDELEETPADDDKRKYLVQRGHERFIIELPANYKVTFGYVNPAKSDGGYSRGEGHCLRVWEGKSLRAVFGNISGFRDLSIPYAMKVEKETGAASWERDSMGNFKESREVKVDHHIEAADDYEDDLPF